MVVLLCLPFLGACESFVCDRTITCICSVPEVKNRKHSLPLKLLKRISLFVKKTTKGKNGYKKQCKG